MTESWAETFVVAVPRVQCPFCTSPDLVRVRSNQLPGGGIERLHVCKCCSRRSRWRITKNLPIGECCSSKVDRAIQ